MDLELREALALSPDRDVAIGQLLPGSQDHDYYRCLRAQHTGNLAEADKILTQWAKNHGRDQRFERLQLRQWLYRAQEDFAKVADKLRDHFGISHWHEREVEDTDPKRPTRLAAGEFDGAKLLREAIDNDDHLSQVTDEGIYELIGSELNTARRRALLQRLGHTPDPGLVAIVAADLAARDSQFGTFAVHQQLTLAQLHELVAQHPKLENNLGWVCAVVKRMQPSRAVVDLEQDREARYAYLKELWAFVGHLPEAINSLKVHVLWHLLDTERRLGIASDSKLFAAYLQLPRYASYLPTKWLEKQKEIAQVGQDFSGFTGLPPALDDEGLVRELLHQRIEHAEQFAPWIERTWLDAEIATARLLYGTGDAEKATLTLGPARAAALRERVDLAWSLHAPTRFGADEPIVLEADVKNVPELVVKVFRVDPHAYFLHAKKEVGTDLDLDGLAASHEMILRFSEPAIRRVRRRIELPMCSRPGTYVIDLIGNGISSRAVVHKGRLRFTSRVGAAGHVITIVDDAGRSRPDARAIIGEREYTPDDKGSFVVPFSTSPSRVPMLLVAGDIATVQRLDLVRETPELACTMLLDREGITSGRTARVILRARLTIAGAPASVTLIKRAMWDVTLTDRAGVSTTRSVPLALTDADATVLELAVGEDTAQISLGVRGSVEIRSEQREQEVADARSFSVADMHGSTAIEAMYLAHTTGGWVISALGKTGEPRARRAVTVSLVHRWSRMQLNVELATDERGRVELGELPGIARIEATLGAASQQWQCDDHLDVTPIHAALGDDVVIPLPPQRTAEEVQRRISIVEVRDVPVEHPAVTFAPLESGLAIRGLPAGTFHVRAPGVTARITVVDAPAYVANAGFSSEEVVELSRIAPTIDRIERAEGDLAITLRDIGPSTRVHVLGVTFVPSLLDSPPIGSRRVPVRRGDRGHAVHYVSGRELGDEYRYILERRGAKRFPGLLLERPPLLLNPWARRTTTTDVATPKAGGSFQPSPVRQQSMGGGGMAAKEAHYGDTESYVTYDFLGAAPVALANLVPDGNGVVRVAAADLGRAAEVIIVVDDPAGIAMRFVPLVERPLEPRDLRLKLALDPERHVSQKKQILPLAKGDRLVIEDLATAKVHLLDSVEKAHGYLLALRDDATLREFAFVTKWHELSDSERREKYSKYACHELHLFLWAKDRAFFDEIVKPYLAHKRTKTFLDHFLLGADLREYLEPSKFARLNAVERALILRSVPVAEAIARLLVDEVSVLPPDPARDTRLIDTLLGAATLDDDSPLADLAEEAYDRAEASVAMSFGSTRGGPPAPPPPAAPAMAAAPMRVEKAKKSAARSRMRDADDMMDMESEISADMAKRDDAPAPMYRSVDKTQEWAEHNWWHRTPQQSTADMITPNRFWRDLAAHGASKMPFLSPSLGLATSSFAEAMCALALTDVPFVSGTHAYTPDGARLEIVTASTALAGSSQLVDGELVTSGPPLVVGMSFVRTDDRHDWIDGEQVDKYVDGVFATGVVYTCQIVLANPTSARQRIAALIQIPRGSIAVAGAKPTTTIDVSLDAYGTHGHEVSFYFPADGRWTHFPVHVSRGGAIVAAAPPRTLDVTSTGAAADPRSWPYLSQHGSLADVVTYLATANLAAIDLTKIAWRLRERPAYDAILDAVERRQAFEPTLWGYAWLHADVRRARQYLRSRVQDHDAGPVLEMLDLDAEELGTYEHLELAPLVNARAHRLGPKLRILNDGLSAQFLRYLDLVAHRPVPTSEDLLAAVHYYLAQDRLEPALETLERVDPATLADRMQYDYLAAFCACLSGNVVRARDLVLPWRDHPVDRWRHRFAAMLAMLDEIEGSAPAVVDPRSREQQHATLAAKQPTFELALDREGVVITSQHVASIELRFFEMDVELLFSRQPFVQSDVSRFSFIEPGSRETLTNLGPEHRIPWPSALRGKNVVVEAVGAGQRKAKVHYANDLTASVANQVGQVRVVRQSDTRPLSATYVKVYARKHGGAVTFYKDGYTDLRGWFDYATLSTNDLDHVERFAILVCSDQAGAAILEASPPTR